MNDGDNKKTNRKGEITETAQYPVTSHTKKKNVSGGPGGELSSRPVELWKVEPAALGRRVSSPTGSHNTRDPIVTKMNPHGP